MVLKKNKTTQASATVKKTAAQKSADKEAAEATAAQELADKEQAEAAAAQELADKEEAEAVAAQELADKELADKEEAEAEAEAAAEAEAEAAKKAATKKKTTAKKKTGPKHPCKAMNVMNPGNFKLSCSETGRLYYPNRVIPLTKGECNIWVRTQLDSGYLVER